MKHKEIMKAWLDGVDVEVKTSGGKWIDNPTGPGYLLKCDEAFPHCCN